MTAPARTTWRAKPCGWRDRERVVALGEEHGPAGPLLLDVLEELAKEQRGDGRVRTGLRSLARAAFLPRGAAGADQARDVLRFAERVGALDDLAITDDDDMTVTCRVSGFAADQGRGYEAVRKGQQRAANDGDDRDAVPVGPDESRQDGTTTPAGPDARDNDPSCPDERDGVPVCPPTGQDRTGTSSLRSEDASAQARTAAAATAKTATSGKDRLPDDLPDRLHLVAVDLHERLGRLAAAKKGADPPTAARVGELVRDFPDHNHAQVAGSFADYWLHGKGKNTVRKDLVKTYRTWVSKELPQPAAALGAAAGHLSVVPGGGAPPDRDRAGDFLSKLNGRPRAGGGR